MTEQPKATDLAPKAPTPDPETTFLTTVDDIRATLKSEAAMTALIARVAAQAGKLVPDLSTEKGRAAIRSNAYRVVKSRTFITAEAEALTSDMKRAVKAIDAVRIDAEKKLKAIEDAARKPVDDWEAAEKQRRVDLQARLDALRPELRFGMTADEVQAEYDRIESTAIDDTWQELRESATAMHFEALRVLSVALEEARKRDANEAELSRLRAEAAIRAEQDREAERLRAIKDAEEAAEAARKRALIERLTILDPVTRPNATAASIVDDIAGLDAIAIDDSWQEFAEEAAKRKADAIATLQERLAEARLSEADAAEAKRVEAAALEAARLVQAEIDKKAAADAAVEAERQRQADEKRKEDEAAAARVADEELRASARRAMIKALLPVLKGQGGKDLQEMIAGRVADALMAGEIPHVEFKP